VENKIFEFMEKLYGELSLFRNDVNKRFDSLEDDVNGVKKDILRIENDLKPKVEAGLDGYKLVYEKLTTLEEKVDEISSKVEKQDVEIRVIKGAK